MRASDVQVLSEKLYRQRYFHTTVLRKESKVQHPTGKCLANPAPPNDDDTDRANISTSPLPEEHQLHLQILQGMLLLPSTARNLTRSFRTQSRTFSQDLGSLRTARLSSKLPRLLLSLRYKPAICTVNSCTIKVFCDATSIECTHELLGRVLL